MKNICLFILIAVVTLAGCAQPPDPKEAKRAAFKKEMAAYWQEVRDAVPQDPPELAMDIPTGAGFGEIADDAAATIDHFEKMLTMVDPSGQGPNWEVLKLGVPNHIKQLRLQLLLLGLKRAEERLLCDPDNAGARQRLDRQKPALLKLAAQARVAD